MRESVLVTGASRGIGRGVALSVAERGYDVVVHYVRDQEAASATAEQVRGLGVDARLLGFDVSNREQARTALEQDIADNGAYYGVVCNAGITRDNPFPAMSGEDWDAVLRTNLDGFYNVVNPLVMPMIRRKKPGRIIAISSIAGLVGNRGQVNYSAAKAGIIGAVKALALELAKRQITVNCIAPGLIETDMTAGLPREQIQKMIPMRRMGTAAEVGAVAGFLCSAEASYITRQVVTVDGGLT
jgi:3-oxoacyl-[acyl-carrier protein] reductase